MSDLDQIVEINISRETQAVSRAAFNIPMFMATHTAFSERAKSYSSLSEVAADFRSTSNVYIAASKLFGQEISPPSIVVGRRQVNEVTGTVAVQNSSVYTLTINGTNVTYTSDSTATTAEIIDGLEAAFTSAGFSGITFTDVSSASFTVAVNSAGTAWSIKATTNITLTNTTPTETWVDALEAIQQANDDWFALTAETHVDSDILAIAASIEAKKKLYFTSTSSSSVKTSSTTDVASQLKAAAYDQTSIIYSAVADTAYPECAWVGGQIPETPGSNTFKFKTLTGVTVDSLSTTEVNYIKGKNCNYYKSIGGVNITAEGVVSSGEFIDVMVGVFWMEARMQERIYSRLVNTKKIPYTAAGFSMIENELRAVMAEAIANGFITENPAPTFKIPNVLSVEPNLKALRTVEGIEFTAVLAGAIHKVSVRGYVSV